MEQLKSYWEYIKSKGSLDSWFYLLSFAVFIIILPYYWLGFENKFLSLINNGEVFDSNQFIKYMPRTISKVKEFVPLSIISFSAILLIFFNTIIYLFEYIKELGANLIKGWANLKVSASFILWGIISLCFLIPISLLIYNIPNELHIKLLENAISSTSLTSDINKIDTEFAEELKATFKIMVHLIEYYVIAVVCSFILIDWASLKMREYTNAHKRELTFIKNQIFLIDIPVLVGSIIILVFATYLENNISTLSYPTIKNIKIDTDAPQVFSLGALAMHLIFSQTIFLILNIRDSYNDHMEEMGKQAENRVDDSAPK